MKESEDKYMNELIDKVMKHAALETPSVDFTSMVMGKVEAIKLNAHTTYEPLISKRVWLLIFSISIVLVVAVTSFGAIDYSSWSNTMDFSFMKTIEFSKISNGMQLSNATRVSIVMFCLMLLIQIPLLKRYFDKRVLN
jgi:hypothetical protein